MKGAQSRTGHFATALAALIVGIALAACGGGSSGTGAQATVPSTTLGSATSYVMPSRITAAYVERVLSALESVQARAGGAIVESHSLSPAAVADLRAIFARDVLVDQVNLWVSQIPGGLGAYKVPVGPVRDRVTSLITAKPTCIFVSVVRDFSAVTMKPPPRHTSYVELLPASLDTYAKPLNPTPWVFGEIGYPSSSQLPPNPCVGSS